MKTNQETNMIRTNPRNFWNNEAPEIIHNDFLVVPLTRGAPYRWGDPSGTWDNYFGILSDGGMNILIRGKVDANIANAADGWPDGNDVDKPEMTSITSIITPEYVKRLIDSSNQQRA